MCVSTIHEFTFIQVNQIVRQIKYDFLFELPDDHSRVLLKGSPEEGASDYINANYIDVSISQ